jgi:alkylation response protein AidB-like acyl-CoA dehydrogenase
LEVDPLTMFRVIEEVARHDSAAAWNLQLAVAADCFLAWLPDEGAAEIMHSHPSTIIATSFTPGRQATPVGGGYRLSGQWPFVSGGHDCHWVFFIPQIMDGDQPRLNDQGSPVQRFLYDTFQETYAAAVQGAEITLDQKLKMQLATSHAVMCAAKAVDLVHAAAGTSSIRNEHKFQKYFRDVHTITQHAFTSASRFESVGALMLGVESDWGFFAF